MVVFPAATAVTIPVDAFTVAAAVLLLLQVPPTLPLLVNGVDKPAHTDAAPLTVPAFGTAFTVTAAEAEELAHEVVTV